MELGWHEALAGVAILFLVFLVVKLRPVTARRAALSSDVQAARERALAATTPRDRAAAYCDAGTLTMAQRTGGRKAAGFFQRAMEADPAWEVAVEHASAALLAKRPRLLEKVLWRRLGKTPWDAHHAAALRAMGRSLRAIYERRHDGPRAEFFRRFVDDGPNPPGASSAIRPLG